MSTERSHRIRRQPPSRTGPIRTAATLLRPAEIPPPPHPPAGPSGPPRSNAPNTEDVVERAIKNAYHVLDEPFRLGQEAAHRYRSFFERGNPMNENRMDSASGFVRLWSDMFSLWLDFLGPFAPSNVRSVAEGFFPGGGTAASHPHPGSAYVPGPEPGISQREWMRVTFEVTTPAQVRVTLDLAPGADLSALIVQDLAAVDGGSKPPIKGAALARADGHPVVHLAIPPGQPPGTYLGMIIDQERAEQRGTLRVVVQG